MTVDPTLSDAVTRWLTAFEQALAAADGTALAALFAEAGDLALRLDLRAYDSVQLASAWRAFGVIGPALQFCCFDRKLNTAAQGLGLPVITAV